MGRVCAAALQAVSTLAHRNPALAAAAADAGFLALAVSLLGHCSIVVRAECCTALSVLCAGGAGASAAARLAIEAGVVPKLVDTLDKVLSLDAEAAGPEEPYHDVHLVYDLYVPSETLGVLLMETIAWNVEEAEEPQREAALAAAISPQLRAAMATAAATLHAAACEAPPPYEVEMARSIGVLRRAFARLGDVDAGVRSTRARASAPRAPRCCSSSAWRRMRRGGR